MSIVYAMFAPLNTGSAARSRSRFAKPATSSSVSSAGGATTATVSSAACRAASPAPAALRAVADAGNDAADVLGAVATEVAKLPCDAALMRALCRLAAQLAFSQLLGWPPLCCCNSRTARPMSSTLKGTLVGM